MDVEDIVKLTHKAGKKFLCYADYLYGGYEDMMSELILQVYKKLPQYDSSRGRVSTFIYEVVTSKVLLDLKVAKTAKRRVNHETMSLDEIIAVNEDNSELTLGDTISADIDIEEQAITNELAEQLKKWLVPETYKMFFEDKNMSEVAEELGVSRENVRRKVTNNINRIKGAIVNKEDIFNKDNTSRQQQLKEIMEREGVSMRTAWRRLTGK